MKTTLPKRSQSYQQDITEITQIIKEIGKAKIAYIILFGSFARGDFYETEIKQESDGSWLEYRSDYDFLIITNRYEQGTGDAARNLERKIEEKITKNLLDKERTVSLIIEPLKRVNKDLKKGHYFFADIKKEGILLYKNEKAEELEEPKELTNAERKELAEGYYEEWMENAEEFWDNALYKFSKKSYKNASFQLHQTVESLY